MLLAMIIIVTKLQNLVQYSDVDGISTT